MTTPFVYSETWYENYSYVVAVGRRLLEKGFTAEGLQRFYEKPWKWTSEFKELVRQCRSK